VGAAVYRFGVAFHLLAAAAVIATAGYSFDVAGLTGPAERFLRWGVDPFYNWKFGADLLALTIASVGQRFVAQAAGLSGVAAAHLAWKLPLLLANFAGALALARIASRFRVVSAHVLAAAWLLNPAVLWVSMVHGQIETLAMAAVFWSVDLALARRWVFCGILVGLGGGIEYFPLGVMVVPLIGLIRGSVAPRHVSRFIAGLVAGLSISFGPALFSFVARDGIVHGLASTASANAVPLYSLDVWWVIGIRHASWWPIAFGGFSLVAFAFCSLSRRFSATEAGVAALCAALIAAVLTDQNSMGQFSVIASGALLMLCAVRGGLTSLALLSGLAGIATYVVAVGLPAFWYDAYNKTFATPWMPSLDQRIIPTATAVFCASTLAGLAVGCFVPRIASRRMDTLVGLGMGAVFAIALVAYGTQPQFWWRVLDHRASDLADFSRYHQKQDAAIAANANAIDLRIPPALQIATPRGRLRAHLEIEGSVPLLYEHLGYRMQPFSKFSAAQTTLWMPAQFRGDRRMTRWYFLGERLPRSLYSLSVGGCKAALEGRTPVSAQVAVFSFEVPARCFAGEPTRYLLAPASILVDGDDLGPWLRVGVASELLKGDIDRVPVRLPLVTNTENRSSLEALPFKPETHLRLKGNAPPLFSPQRYLLVWPPDELDHSVLAFVFGVVATLLDIGVVFALLRKPPKQTIPR
jgi:hypothetical protein